ncbi:TrmH family RNA methyltransferase [Helicobacter kayseriensis]|uniref:TrmH family RNA methyltransferase n=1 Tax=Helicobacter kayseriensis TaxID=2905877 RepID=UPI001E4CA27D|nr:RNA methyltransferase [Helicobacter kayseriensis]MCE3046965.1 RNA methyltransferase [Helicobacter kayseriensis]MCE3048375.1 RNA methyltransferase [Helicobacter kayseriensis]
MIVYGKQIVLHLLNRSPQRIREVFLAKEIDAKLFRQIARLNIPIVRLDSKKAQAMARGGNHQGFLIRIELLEPTPWKSMLELSSLLVLCGVSDVGNIASLARSAYALGVGGMILDSISPKALETIVRLSSGAMLELPFYYSSSLLDEIHQIKQASFECYGADMKGEEINSFHSCCKWALFLGSEGSGLSQKIIQKMDKMVSIRMRNSFDSLNVGVAGGILMHRLVKE